MGIYRFIIEAKEFFFYHLIPLPMLFLLPFQRKPPFVHQLSPSFWTLLVTGQKKIQALEFSSPLQIPSAYYDGRRNFLLLWCSWNGQSLKCQTVAAKDVSRLDLLLILMHKLFEITSVLKISRQIKLTALKYKILKLSSWWNVCLFSFLFLWWRFIGLLKGSEDGIDRRSISTTT